MLEDTALSCVSAWSLGAGGWGPGPSRARGGGACCGGGGGSGGGGGGGCPALGEQMGEAWSHVGLLPTDLAPGGLWSGTRRAVGLCAAGTPGAPALARDGALVRSVPTGEESYRENRNVCLTPGTKTTTWFVYRRFG